MNKLTKNIVILVILVLVIWGGVKYFGEKEPEITEPIKIGVIVPLSGPAAIFGENAQKAILLAQEELGKSKYKYEVLFEDGQFDIVKSVASANKLINVDKVDILITSGSGVGNAISPITLDNNVIHFCVASEKNIAEGKSNFIHWTPPSEVNKVFIEKLQKENIQKLGYFGSQDQAMTAIIDDLKIQLKDTDIEIFNPQIVDLSNKDFKSSITKVKQDDVDAYLILVGTPALEILVKQMKELGIKKPLVAIQVFESSRQPELFEGYWYANGAQTTNEFNDKFFAKTGVNPTMGTANSYDIFNLIVLATEKIKSKTKPEVNQIIEELNKIKNFDGALGNLEIVEPGIVWSKGVIKKIENGKHIVVSE